MDNCIFCKIVAGEIPSAKVYEDDKMLVFKDIEPKAKVHLLCVPKEHFAFLSEADEKRVALIGSMLQTVGAHYKEWGLQEGYRVVINQGENAGQTVMHLRALQGMGASRGLPRRHQPGRERGADGDASSYASPRRRSSELVTALAP